MKRIALILFATLLLAGCTTLDTRELLDGIERVGAVVDIVQTDVTALAERDDEIKATGGDGIGTEELVTTAIGTLLASLGAVGVWRGSPSNRKGSLTPKV